MKVIQILDDEESLSLSDKQRSENIVFWDLKLDIGHVDEID